MSGSTIARRAFIAVATGAVLLAAAVCFAPVAARVEDPSGGGRSAGIAASQAGDAVSGLQAAAVPPSPPGGDESAGTSESPLHRVLGTLEYVASDYDNAIGEGAVVLDVFEYEEQKQFLAQAAAMLAASEPPASPAARQQLGAIRSLVLARRPARDVVPRLRALHVRLVREFDVVLTPQQIPSLASGRILFEQACAACHGPDGRAQTERARELHPHPVDFHSPDLERRLSPYLAFSVVTFGVPGTAMAGFPTLTEEERWDLAFFVCALRHPAPQRPANATVAQAAGNAPASLTLADLTRSTDSALRTLVRGLTPAEQAAQLARWRWVPPLEIGR